MTFATDTIQAPARSEPRVERDDIVLDRPCVDDGAALWRIARDSAVLDLNSSYSYLLWCRDFAATSVVARAETDDVVGFVTGYRRPNADDTLVVWQVAVDATYRGRGLAASMVDHLLQQDRHRFLETTVTDDNLASQRLFSSVAARRSAPLKRTVLFDEELFPEPDHRSEVLFRIGPLAGPSTTDNP